MKVALTVGGSDAGGSAGVQADYRAFHVAGIHGTSVITAIMAQNTRGGHAIYPLSIDAVAARLDAVLGDMNISAVKTGMLYSCNVASLVAEKLSEVPLVVDPVLVSTTRDTRSSAELASMLKDELLPISTVATPNVEEAEQLTGISIDGLDDLREVCRALHGMGSDAVVVTGWHRDEATDLFYDGDTFTEMTLPLLQRNAYGSGCTFSAYTAAFLARGAAPREAVMQAKRYTWTAVAGAYTLGCGVDVARQRAMPLPVMDGDRTQVWRALQQAVDALQTFLPRRLMPEVGINVAYALHDATSHAGVCAVRGRLAYTDGPVQVGECRFGASRHVASIVLATMQHDASMRSAMNVAYQEDVVAACRDAGLTTGSFDRADEPPGRSTMEWGTGRVIEQRGGIPDVIWDEGDIGKEPMIRVLGTTPRQVVAKVHAVADELSG